MNEIYASCDVWMMGSGSEGFSLIPLEAMSCRTQVVSSSVGEAIESIEDGVNGFLITVGDANALAERSLRVLSMTNSQWERMSERAVLRAKSYSWEDATDRFEQALRT